MSPLHPPEVEDPSSRSMGPEAISAPANRKLRILHINTLGYGGAAIAARRLHEGLLEAGHASRLLVQDPGQSLSERAVVLDKKSSPTLTDPLLDHFFDVVYQTCRAPGVDVLFSSDRPTRDLSAHPAVQWADVINLHWLAWMLSAPAIAAIQQLGKPVVWTLHDQFPFTGGCHYSGSCNGYQSDCSGCSRVRPDVQLVPKLVLQQKRRWLDPSRLSVVSPSNWLAAAARQSTLLRDADIRVISNGVRVGDYQRQSREEARRFFGLSPDATVLLFGADNLGESRKGYAHLSEALRRLAGQPAIARRLANGTLLCASFGRAAAASGDVPVLHLGALSAAHVATAYRAADLFVLPTLEDNLPNTMLEAVSAGTPVVGYATGGVVDVVADGGCGVVVEPANVEALAGAMAELIADPQRLERLRPVCEAFARARLSQATQARAYAALYDELLARPGTGERPGVSLAMLGAEESQVLAQIRQEPALTAAPFSAFRDEIARQRNAPHQRRGRAKRRPGEAARVQELRDRLTVLDGRAADLERLGQDMANSLKRLEDEGRLLQSETGLDWLLTARSSGRRESPLQGPGVPGLVSVVMPVHNMAPFLEEAIRSVWNQTAPSERVELIVVDDGSTDGSRELAHQLCEKSPVRMRVLTHAKGQNRGVSASRNLALEYARGEFIALLDGDDVYLPTRLAAGLDYLNRHTSCHVLCSQGVYIDDHGFTITGPIGSATAGDYRALSAALQPPFTMEALWADYPVTNSTLLVRREALAAVGAYPEDMAQGEDRLIVLKLSVDHPIHCLDEKLIRYRHHASNATSAYLAHNFEPGVRIDLLYKLVHWMMHERPEQRHRALALFRRNHQLVLAGHPRIDRARQELLDRVCGQVGLDADAFLALRARELAELDVLRRVVPAALRDARDARAEVERLRANADEQETSRCA